MVEKKLEDIHKTLQESNHYQVHCINEERIARLEEKVNANFGMMYHGSRTVTIDDKYRVKYIDVTTEESDGFKKNSDAGGSD